VNYETKFGRELLRGATPSGQILKKRLLFIIPALIFLAFGALVLVNPDVFEFSAAEMDTATFKLLPLLFFAAGAIFVLIGIFRIKPAQVFIYEKGFAHIGGSKITEVDFGDVKGVANLKSTLKYMGELQIAKSKHEVTIVKNDGNKICLGPFTASKLFLPQAEQTADELDMAITKYLLKDVTKENIAKVNISFGDALELTGGQLAYKAGGKKSVVYIPLDAVKDISFSEYWMELKGASGEKLASIQITNNLEAKMLNSEAFRHIMRMIQPE
jgi:hypothetical protein